MMLSSNAEYDTSENPEVKKLPFKRIKFALDQIINTALPLHIQLLNEKSENIQLLKSKNSLSGLHAEQADAAKYLKLLKQDLSDLEDLNCRVEDADKELFYEKIKISLKPAVETVTRFMELHPDALEPFPDFAENITPEIPKVVCYLDKASDENEIDNSSQSLPLVPVQAQAILTSKSAFPDAILTSKSAFPDWSFLRKELIEVHNLIKRFSTLVFSQKEHIDTIQNNVEKTHENVLEGVTHLKRASLLKTASFPVLGAIVGGVLLGPVGALAGLKLIGTVTVMAGGGAVGYKVGTSMKKKQEISSDIEMKALTCSSKQKSNSNPEISSDSKDN